ncbi:phospho-sugar glycosidase domain-containing protein [Spiroplasma endosymbiont of Othius punctulatus]|uniref:phospho-sugar glycosidase domain-containing protein n=1 Tax=Spiroplasma endosymbiont of Othius punctulatus TaxID=3066289 RepID=UPI0030CC5BC2
MKINQLLENYIHRVLFYSNTINNVLFGNAFATEEELKKVSEVDREEITFGLVWDKSITKPEQEIANYKEHFRRGDITEFFIRSTMSRVIWSSADIKPRDSKKTYNKGDVVIVNNNGASYKGELHIILVDGYADTKKQYNTIGKIQPGELFLMNFVGAWSRFRFN